MLCPLLAQLPTAALCTHNWNTHVQDMIEAGIYAVLVKVACLGLQPRKHLGRSLAEVQATLLELEDAYGCNACGEGGEFETMTLDCPAFKYGRIELQVWSTERMLTSCHHTFTKMTSARRRSTTALRMQLLIFLVPPKCRQGTHPRHAFCYNGIHDSVTAQGWTIQHVNEDAVCPVAALTPTVFSAVTKSDNALPSTARVHHVPLHWLPPDASDHNNAAAGGATKSALADASAPHCASAAGATAAAALPQVAVQWGQVAASAHVCCEHVPPLSPEGTATAVASGLAALAACVQLSHATCSAAGSVSFVTPLKYCPDISCTPGSLRVHLCTARKHHALT